MNRTKSQCAPMQKIRCAIYTRKSTDEGLDQEFNSLDTQRESAESYIQSQRHEGWIILPHRYDNGGFSGGSMDRPALNRLMSDIEQNLIDCVVVYKVDRLSRSITDFCKIMDLFDSHNVTFVSVTQAFNTTTSMGRLTLNILLSFAQFEREVIGERIRDKIAALKRKGRYTGGRPILGYDIDPSGNGLLINKEESKIVRHIFERFLILRSPLKTAQELNSLGYRTKQWVSSTGTNHGGNKWSRTGMYRLLKNRLYIGQIRHKNKYYDGEHEPIISKQQWNQVQAIISENQKIREGLLRVKPPALLQRIIRCSHCNCAMTQSSTMKNGKKYRYYTCSNASKRGFAVCPVKSVSAVEIEKVVFEYVRKIFKTPEMFTATIQSVNYEYKNQLHELRQQQNDIPKSHSDRNNLPVNIKDELSGITNRLYLLESHPVSESDILQAMENFESIWDELFPAEQARIVSLIFHKILVYPDGIELFIRIDGFDSFINELVESGNEQEVT